MDYVARTPDQLGPILKSVRKQRRLTQHAASAKVGMPQKAVSLVEAQPGKTSVERLYKVLSALDLELVIRDKQRTRSTKTKREW